MIANTLKKRLTAVEAAARGQIAAKEAARPPAPLSEQRRLEKLAIIDDRTLTMFETRQRLIDHGFGFDERAVEGVRKLLDIARTRRDQMKREQAAI